ncbi:hypothetical protein ABT278_12040 [Streptomyces sp. NPDC001228]|uniref:hypothetical protein n=1 Tax=Streptomyces sp. NPDC001228 TaxID=3154381 RepID=UPI0033342D54
MRKAKHLACAAVLTVAISASITSTASATDFQQAIRHAQMQARLAAHNAAPVSLTDAPVWAETIKFMNAAKADGETEANIDALLTDGSWVVYPVDKSLVVVTSDSDAEVDPETQPEVSAADQAAAAPGAAEVTQAETVTPDDGSMDTPDPADGPTRCTSHNATIKMQNVSHNTLWYYTLAEHYCYRGGAITSYEAEPTVTHKVYGWAELLGWSWEGADLSGTKGPSRYSWHGSSHGGLKTWRRGQFKYSPYRIGHTQQKFPQIHLYEHADGNYFYTWDI